MLRGQKLVPDLEGPSLGCALTTHVPLGGPRSPFGLPTLHCRYIMNSRLCSCLQS